MNKQSIIAFNRSLKTGVPFKIEVQFKNLINNNKIWILCNLEPITSKKNPSHYIGTITDISEFKQIIASLQKTSRYDHLTKLPNRYLFEEILIKSIARAKRNSNILALFYIDLDFFKNVNDFFGHGIGDAFLREVGVRLKKSVRIEDYIVRLGGDEFAVIFEDIENYTTISLTAQRLLNNFSKPFYIASNEIRSSLSIGISVFPSEDTTVKTIVQHADQALYQAKEAGRNCYRYYNKNMQVKLERYMLIVENLRNAIEENQFELCYQPKINIKSNAMVGIEALLRWNNPYVCNCSPSEFIIIAEETGLMSNIGDWVIKTALNQYKEWFVDTKKMKEVTISINISASQLNNSSIIETLTNALRDTQIPTQNILFELTETALMKKAFDNNSVLKIFLEELGIKISIDDFGTGYSSLTYLKQLPIKELKIDKSFIDDIGKNINSEVIIKAIINLALTLDLDVVAEGVETKIQLDFLMENECKIMQGYYFSKPLSAEQLTRYIASNNL